MGLELAKAFVTVAADARQLLPSLDGTKSTIMSALGSLGGMISGIITKGFMLGIGAIGAAVTGIFVKGIIDTAKVEQTTIALETMLGSAEKAKILMQQMTDFAAKTPFELPGITGTSKVLLAFGLQQKEILPTLKMLGDVAAGTGKDLQELGVIYGQIRASGRLMGGDMLQLVNAGIPIISTLAKQYGVAESEIKKMSEQGKISFKDVEKAFQTMSGEGGLFFNMMERQSGTMIGMWSTLMDAVSIFGQRAVAPLIPTVQKMLGVLIENMETASNWVNIFAQNWIGTWGLLAQASAVAISGLWDYFIDFLRELPTMLATPFSMLMVFIDSMLHHVAQGIPEAIVQATYDAFRTQGQMYAEMDFAVSDKTQARIDKLSQMAMRMASGLKVKELGDDLGNEIGDAAGQAMAAKVTDLLGFHSIEDISRKSQELALKAEKDGPQAQLVGIAELQLKKQDEIVQAIKQQKGAGVAVLQ